MGLLHTIKLSWLLLIITATTANGQKAEARLNPDDILPGKPAELIIEAEAPAAGTLIWPQTIDPGNKIEILESGQTDTIRLDDSTIQLRQVYRITAWEEGYFAIPPVEFMYADEGDTLVFESRAILLSAEGVEVDLQDAYRDIKPLFGFPLTWREILPWILAAGALLAILYYLYKKIRYRTVKSAPDTTAAAPEPPEVPPHIAAISGLESLRRKNLWENGFVKQYHSELTDIIRKYLEQRFNLNAMEMTTSEIMQAFSLQKSKSAKESTLRNIMHTADLVKFARYRPDGEINEMMLENALAFIKSTIPEESAKQWNPNS